MKFNQITKIIASVIMLWGVAACSDDDMVPLGKSTAEVESSTFNTLSFEWKTVADAVQYSYQLTKTTTGDVISTGITQSRTMMFADLEPSTEYTLTVLAYAAMDSEYTTSEPIVLTARTADLVAVAAPQPVQSREVNTIILSWEKVESAQSYAWQLFDADNQLLDEGEVSALSVSFPNMPSGTYTFSVTAYTETPGFKDGEPGSLTFDFLREREEVERVQGTYISALTSSSWSAELVVYDNNSYTIESWYGVEGYNFTFTLGGQEGESVFTVSGEDYEYDSESQSYSVPTGLTDGPANVSLFPGQSDMDMDDFSVTLNVSDGVTTGNDLFIRKVEPCTIDELCGEWIRHYTCKFGSDFWDNTMSVEITKIDETTIRIPLPLYNNEYADMRIDFETMTFTLNPSNMTVGYIFAKDKGETVPLTGSISSTGFKINKWGLFWSGNNYCSNTTMEFYRAEE